MGRFLGLVAVLTGVTATGCGGASAEEVCETFCSCLDEQKNGCGSGIDGCVERLEERLADSDDSAALLDCVQVKLVTDGGECTDLSNESTVAPSDRLSECEDEL